MKNKIKLFEAMSSIALIALVAVIGFSFASCKEPEEETPPTEYTVWTFSQTYNESDWQTPLADNTFYKAALTDAQFAQYNVADQYKRSWTRAEIFNWFKDRTFNDTQGNTETDWFISQTHAVLYLKIDTTVFFILK